MPGLLRQPQDTITPSRGSQLLFRALFVHVRTRLILVGRSKIDFSLFEPLKRPAFPTLYIQLVQRAQLGVGLLFRHFQDLLRWDRLVNTIIQVTQPKYQIVIGNTNGRRSRCPLTHTSISNDFSHGIFSNFEGQFLNDIEIIGISSGNVFPMRGQVTAHKAHRRIVKLYPNTDTTLVSHHPHDSHTHRITRHGLDPTSVRGFDKDTDQ
mmetsp:Transcript_22262/g.33936  ORF Transcript_22262/g.33936 Transcript_22262/m.33936 type:complete len:208 (-) Transcript_22262:712-1335(-)